MSSGAISSYGTLLQRETFFGSGVYVTVAEVKSMAGPGMKADSIDVTTHSSAASGAWREKRPGLLDAGDLSFPINLVPASAGHKALLADFVARTLTNYKITFPDAGLTPWLFPNCFMSQFNAKATIDGVLEADITLTLSGAPTFP